MEGGDHYQVWDKNMALGELDQGWDLINYKQIIHPKEEPQLGHITAIECMY